MGAEKEWLEVRSNNDSTALLRYRPKDKRKQFRIVWRPTDEKSDRLRMFLKDRDNSNLPISQRIIILDKAVREYNLRHSQNHPPFKTVQKYLEENT